MEQYNHELVHPEERKAASWRSYRGRSGRAMWGLILSSISGFWLVNNLTDNAALTAENPGRVVLPALVILLGLVAMFTNREPQLTNKVK